MKKRLLAALLSMLMIVSVVPVLALTSLADVSTATVSDAEYLSFPITIRDYAADGMLFEWNEITASGAYGTNQFEFSTYTTLYNPSDWATNDYKGVRIVPWNGTYATLPDNYEWWHCIIIGYDGRILYVMENGDATSKELYYDSIMASDYDGDTSTVTGSDPYYAIWVWSGDEAYAALSQINNNTIGEIATYTPDYFVETRDYDIGDYCYINVPSDIESDIETDGYGTVYYYTRAQTMHQYNNIGFGMLFTDDNSYVNNLAQGGSVIQGSQYISNGVWNSSEAPTDVIVTLNSGVQQSVHGALIRPDLVEPTLGANGKPIYIQSAVDYIAGLLQTMLNVDYENEDGSVNNYFLMGTKLYNDDLEFVGPASAEATKDLAQVFRESIVGTGYVENGYTAAKEKFEAGQLTKPTDCETYYEIAYFLMHSTFMDNDGYGTTVEEYEYINLKKVDNEDGSFKYIFNSAYDDTEYDATNGVIYNTQTTDITARQTWDSTTETDVDFYTRGHKQPEWTFNPIENLGYGKSGCLYNDNIEPYLTISDGYYYDDTNYNLTLEGHGKFVYNQAENLYFTFTGDDDVYLYINGTRILDLGGAHSISACTVSLNDVATVLGLSDGDICDLDFFYMERHGTAANFGIETNIQVVDPSMITEKNAYQSGAHAGQGGYINEQFPVIYEFIIKNAGEDAITDLTFTDATIGVTLTPDSITLNSETNISDLHLRIREYDVATDTVGDNIVYIAAGDLTEEKLKELLATGIDVGQTFEIYGFKYTIPEESWKEVSVDNTTEYQFVNTVNTTAVSFQTHQPLTGTATCYVRKFEYPMRPVHVYEWAGETVTITKQELYDNLVNSLLDKNPDFDLTALTIDITDFVICDALGNTGSSANTKAVVNSDGSITYTGAHAGTDTFYYFAKCSGSTGDFVFRPTTATVYSYDVADDNIVLDYGLPVNLTADGGITKNDILSLPGNAHPTAYKLELAEQGSTSNYGLTTVSDNTITYTMNKFMEGEDNIYLNVSVQETAATGEITKFNGVEMNETVTILPANVVYYEDDFASINYNGSWVAGAASAGTQSPDASLNYGNDPYYQNDQSGSNDSNGNIHTLNVPTGSAVDAFTFDFCGTGFDLVSRTTMTEYAVIAVKVYPIVDGVVSENFSYALPVITESKGGTLYQIPVIKVRDIAYGQYRVVVTAAASTEAKTRVLYLDGVRIYDPIQDTSKYLDTEKDVTVLNIKEQIESGKIAYYTVDNGGSTLSTGNTMVEYRGEDKSFTLTTDAGDPDEYLNNGPNNEIYFNGLSSSSVIAFYIEKDANVDDANRTLQIAVHRKAVDTDNTVLPLVYGSTAEAISGAKDGDSNYFTIASGTENYFTIDIANLSDDDGDGKYLVMIGTNCQTASTAAVLALTNIKINGYTISNAQLEVSAAVANMNSSSSLMLYEASNLQTIVDKTTFVYTDVSVNEELTIISASAENGQLTVVASASAESISVLDMYGNEVSINSVTKTDNGDNTVTFVAEVELNAGQTYTVRAFDADGNASDNKYDVCITD